MMEPQDRQQLQLDRPHTEASIPTSSNSVLDVAQYFVKRVDRESGDVISPLKLQKLVYYAQAWSLVLKDKPIFSDEIEAWVHGPVVHKVWEAYKDYRYDSIPESDEPLPNFSDEQLEVLDEVWDAYGELSAKRLENLTHSEPPWISAREGLGLGEKSRKPMSLEEMKAYYGSLISQDEKSED